MVAHLYVSARDAEVPGSLDLMDDIASAGALNSGDPWKRK